MRKDFDLSVQGSLKLSELSSDKVGKVYEFKARVESIYQTSGPTVFDLYDGTSRVRSVAFNNGQRAYPKINDGNFVKVDARIKDRNNSLELEIINAKILDDSDKALVMSKIDSRIEKKIAPALNDFLIESDVLNRLKPRFIEAARMIKRAVSMARPIILRHHFDCDGYSAAIAIERAVLPMIEKVHKSSNLNWKYYRRAPSNRPFYGYDDVTKDLGLMINDMRGSNLVESLIVIVDNGSTEEDLLAIKKAKIYGCQIIVVDHHFPGEIKDGFVAVDPFVDVHINPYLAGGDSNLCAGMLSTELSRFISGDNDSVNYLAGLAGVGDRVSGNEFDSYLKISEELGYSKEFLAKLAEVIDFESSSLRNFESRGYVDDLMGADKNVQERLVGLISEEIENRKKNRMKNLIHFVNVDELSDRVIAKIDLKSTTNIGFPSMGKSTGMLFDYLKENYDKPVFVVGYSDTLLVLRMSDKVRFNLNTMISELAMKYDYASIEGGGHEHAGSVKFISKMRPVILDEIFGYFKNAELN